MNPTNRTPGLAPPHRPGVRPALLALVACAALSLPLSLAPTTTSPVVSEARPNPATSVVGPRSTPSAASRSHVRPVLPTPTVRQVTRRPAKRVTRTGPWGLLSNRALAQLRACESGNYQRNSGNGYYGAYQFEPGTWRGLWQRHGRPDLASLRPDRAAPADQDRAVRLLFAERGPQPWPGCSRKSRWWLA